MRKLQSVSTRMVYEVPVGAPIRWEATVFGQVRACSGKMWLTRESDPRDYWLTNDSRVSVAPGDVLWVGNEGGASGRLELRFDAHPAGARWSVARLTAAFSPRRAAGAAAIDSHAK